MQQKKMINNTISVPVFFFERHLPGSAPTELNTGKPKLFDIKKIVLL